jgi:hypothetical protein
MPRWVNSWYKFLSWIHNTTRFHSSLARFKILYYPDFTSCYLETVDFAGDGSGAVLGAMSSPSRHFPAMVSLEDSLGIPNSAHSTLRANSLMAEKASSSSTCLNGKKEGGIRMSEPPPFQERRERRRRKGAIPTRATRTSATVEGSGITTTSSHSVAMIRSSTQKLSPSAFPAPRKPT